MIDLVQLGKQVRSTRKALGLSQSELVEKSGVSRARIDALENGRATEMGVKHLGRLLHALGLDLRITTLNNDRPTLEDLRSEASDDAPRLGR